LKIKRQLENKEDIKIDVEEIVCGAMLRFSWLRIGSCVELS
jgi:hypothetical protein